MKMGKQNLRFGTAWVVFALALALHVTDEATHNFLGTYNPSVRWIRARVPFLLLPTFTFRVWLTLLVAAILLLLCVSPLTLRGHLWLRRAAWPIGILVGALNALGHISGSIYFRRWMPGVYSSPVLLLAAIYLLVAGTAGRESNARDGQAAARLDRAAP
ncbi:MAG TPA: HXXEE domain-containing protein [Candidatus Acidoferrum sp.]|nr:HXXEE domain-containing protein [Candidatus Acidoferrum sp.]